MISIKELASNNNDISSTRWAFVNIIRFDIVAASVVILSSIVGHFVGKPLPKETIDGTALLIGTITTIIGGSKVLQGFERNEK